MKYKRTNLNFEYNEFEPIIDSETMKIHYEIHHKEYEERLNVAIEESKYVDQFDNLENLMKNYQKIDNPELRVTVREHGGGLINHNFLFNSLTKEETKLTSNELINEINEHWGSFEEFKKDIIKQGMTLFGSGWIWFVKRKTGGLKIIKTFNQDNPWFLGFVPLFGIDLWEHAYYLKYKSNKEEYIKKMLLLVDWEKVEINYKKK